jgi:hypothetical protein
MNRGTADRPYGAEMAAGAEQGRIPRINWRAGASRRLTHTERRRFPRTQPATAWSLGITNNESVSVLYPRDVPSVSGPWRNSPARRTSPCQVSSAALYQQELRMCKLFTSRGRAKHSPAGTVNGMAADRKHRPAPAGKIPDASGKRACPPCRAKRAAPHARAQSPTRASGDGCVIVCNNSVAPPKIQAWLAT